MCYAKPGPRCTAHAKKALDAARAERDAAMEAYHSPEGKAANKQMHAEYSVWMKQVEQETGELPNRAAQKEWLDAHPYRHQYGERAARSHPALVDAQDAYDATPGGIADLKARLAQLEEEHGDAVLAVWEYPNTQARLAAAQQRRAEQLAAYKEVQVALGKAAAPEPEQMEDEEAASAPAPACSCIEYRYKSDCAHLTARVAKAREIMLPTSHAASFELHAARSRRRGAEKNWTALKTQYGLDAATSREVSDATARHPDLKAAGKAFSQAADDEFNAEMAFFGTDAGRALLNERIARGDACTGYGPHFMGGWESIRRDAAGRREQNAARFEGLTGAKAGVGVDDARVPELHYAAGSGCPEGCKDFAWAAKCVHTDTEWASSQRLVNAIRQMPEVKAMNKAISRELGPRKRGLARLFSRG